MIRGVLVYCLAFHASIQAWASAARPSGVSAPPAGADPFQLSIHFLRILRVGVGVGRTTRGLGLGGAGGRGGVAAAGGVGGEEAAEGDDGGERAAGGRARVGLFLGRLLLGRFRGWGGLGGGRLGGGCGFAAALAGLRLQPGDLGAVEAGLGGALGFHLLVEGGRVRGGGWDGTRGMQRRRGGWPRRRRPRRRSAWARRARRQPCTPPCGAVDSNEILVGCWSVECGTMGRWMDGSRIRSDRGLAVGAQLCAGAVRGPRSADWDAVSGPVTSRADRSKDDTARGGRARRSRCVHAARVGASVGRAPLGC